MERDIWVPPPLSETRIRVVGCRESFFRAPLREVKVYSAGACVPYTAYIQRAAVDLELSLRIVVCTSSIINSGRCLCHEHQRTNPSGGCTAATTTSQNITRYTGCFFCLHRCVYVRIDPASAYSRLPTSPASSLPVYNAAIYSKIVRC